jgi:hypothetical protein
MAGAAETNHVIQRMGFLCILETPNWLDVVNVRVTANFFGIFPASLASVSVPFECFPANPPPLRSIIDLPTFPLVMSLTNHFVREPFSVAFEVAKSASFRVFDLGTTTM